MELTSEERTKRTENVHKIMEAIRPAVQADGGDIHLRDLDVDSGIVTVELTGACTTCAISGATLEAGVQRILKDRLPWVTEVLGSTAKPDATATGTGAWTPSSKYTLETETVISGIGSSKK